MGSLYSVVKAGLINSIGINKILKEGSYDENYKGAPKLIGMIFISLMILALPFVYSNAMANMLEPYGMLELILITAIVGGSAMAFFTSIFKAQGILFASKDYEMLMSLPIKESVILASKMIQLLLLNYLFMGLFIIPPSIVYFSRVTISPIVIIYLLVAFIFAPLLPIVAASIIAFLLSYISSKVKFKNLVIVVGSLGATLLIFLVSLKANDIIAMVLENGDSLKAAIGKIYPLALYFTDALSGGSFIGLLKFVAASLIPFIIFLVVFAKAYKTINAKLGENFKSANYKLTSLKTKSKEMALTRKELKRYFGSPIYVLNTSVGILLVTIGSFCIVFFGQAIVTQFIQIPGAEEMIPLIMLGALIFGVNISCTTNSSISLEGKNLWILKSSPLDEMDIFKGKIAVNLIILLPMILVNSILLLIGLKLDFVTFIWMIIIPTLYAFIIAISGLLINLKFPKLDWVTEVSVVKQGASVMISMLFGLLIGITPIGVLISLKVININMALAVLSVILIFIVCGLWALLKTKGRELFNKL